MKKRECITGTWSTMNKKLDYALNIWELLSYKWHGKWENAHIQQQSSELFGVPLVLASDAAFIYLEWKRAKDAIDLISLHRSHPPFSHITPRIPRSLSLVIANHIFLFWVPLLPLGLCYFLHLVLCIFDSTCTTANFSRGKNNQLSRSPIS